MKYTELVEQYIKGLPVLDLHDILHYRLVQRSLGRMGRPTWIAGRGAAPATDLFDVWNGESRVRVDLSIEEALKVIQKKTGIALDVEAVAFPERSVSEFYDFIMQGFGNDVVGFNQYRFVKRLSRSDR